MPRDSVLRSRRLSRVTPGAFFDAADIVLIVALGAAAVSLLWAVLRPYGPVGPWQGGVGVTLAAADPALLTRFDPFFRSAPAAGTAVTSLPLKLFGTRTDQAMGRGSAIIATPDGLQNSFGIGDEIVPGVKLKSVAFDSVTIDRVGTVEQLFLDQSVAAPVASSATPLPAAAPSPAQSPSPTVPQSLANSVTFAPRLIEGAPSGLIVSPRGNSPAFAASGLQAGDVVIEVNGTRVADVASAAAALGNPGGDGQVRLIVERAGKPVTLTTKVSP